MKQFFLLNSNTSISTQVDFIAVKHTIAIIKRDLKKVFFKTNKSGGHILLKLKELDSEEYIITICEKEVIIEAFDELGFIYGLFYISNHYLDIQPFWFWNNQIFEKKNEIEIEMMQHHSKKQYVRFRGWFINDEVLLNTWSAEMESTIAWEMVFEALLRCGGNMVIPGTDTNSKTYASLASKMGLWITHHHAEPLGAEMFARVYPDKSPSYAENSYLFHKLWIQGIKKQKHRKIVWNLGFRGQGDCPFWETDPLYDTDEARGKLISQLLVIQYNLIKGEIENPVCCTNLYGEVMELYQKGYINIPEDIICIWADNGYGKMVSRRQGNHNPRIRALPENNMIGLHGVYYHTSFYDLQAANHITMFPNSLEFVRDELKEAFQYGAKDYIVVNCSNIKPHVFHLAAISKLWLSGDINTNEFKLDYISRYYTKSIENPFTKQIASVFTDYANATIMFGSEVDEKAGEQFVNYTTRTFITHWMQGRNETVDTMLWATGKLDFREQIHWYLKNCESGRTAFEQLYKRCEMISEEIDEEARNLFRETIYLQVKIHLYCMEGAIFFCQAYEEFWDKNYDFSFYLAGEAKASYQKAVDAMTESEKGAWVNFYKNECLTDIKFTAYLLGNLMGYIRVFGEGPHYYNWQREYLYKEKDKRVVLITNMENRLTNEEMYQCMKNKGLDPH